MGLIPSGASYLGGHDADFGRSRKLNGESEDAPLAVQRAFDPDRAGHRFHQPLGNTKTQTRSGEAARQGAIDLSEGLEQAIKFLWLDADTGVFDADL